jgi:hypothetical protein
MKTKPLEEVKSFLINAFAGIDSEGQKKDVTPSRIEDIRIIIDEAIINIKDRYEHLKESLKDKKMSKYTASERAKLEKAKSLYDIITKKGLTKTEAKIIKQEIRLFAGQVQHKDDAKKTIVSQLTASWRTRFDTFTIEQIYNTAIEELQNPIQQSSHKWTYILEKSYLFHDAIDTIQLYANELLVRMSGKISPREQLVQQTETTAC